MAPEFTNKIVIAKARVKKILWSLVESYKDQ